ncbi:hypothetical protein ACLOJK_028874, partial [Asimina triloba]
ETFFRWCQNSAHPNTPAALASSLSGARKKKRGTLKRPHLSVEEELASKEEVDPRTAVAPSP